MKHRRFLGLWTILYDTLRVDTWPCIFITSHRTVQSVNLNVNSKLWCINTGPSVLTCAQHSHKMSMGRERWGELGYADSLSCLLTSVKLKLLPTINSINFLKNWCTKVCSKAFLTLPLLPIGMRVILYLNTGLGMSRSQWWLLLECSAAWKITCPEVDHVQLGA